MSDETVSFESREGKPVVTYGGHEFAGPRKIARHLSRDDGASASATAHELGRAFAFLVAGVLSPGNDLTRYDLQECADPYYVTVGDEALDEALEEGSAMPST